MMEKPLTDHFDAIGENTHIFPGVEIVIEKRASDGRGLFMGKNGCIYPRNRLVLGDMVRNQTADLRIGDHVLINAGGYLSGEGGLWIADYVLIGPHVSILSAGHAYNDLATPIREQPLTYGAIHIERDAWIGAGAIILQGVRIGAQAVVGAGAVVCGNIPPRAVVAGNPARIIKYRGANALAHSGFERFPRRLLLKFFPSQRAKI